MIKHILTLFLVLMAFPLKSQTTSWFNHLYNIYEWDGFLGVQEIPHEGFIALALSDEILDRSAMVVVRTNLRGEVLWTKIYGDPNLQYGVGGLAQAFIQTNDGGYAYGGSLGSFINGDTDGLLVKFDQHGDTLWTQTYPGPDSIGVFSACKQTTDSGFILLGWSQEYDPNRTHIWLLKADKNGNFEWEKTLGTTTSDIGYSIEITNDGGYILGCNSIIKHGGGNYIIKTNSVGTVSWEKVINVNNPYQGGFCFQAKDSNYIVYSSMEINGKDNAFIAKLSQDGDSILWQYHYGGPEDDWLEAARELPDGSIIAVGNSYSVPENYNDTNGWLLKLSANGDSLWAKDYRVNTEDDNYFWDIQPTTDKGFIIAGSGSISTQDGWLVKVDSLGNGCFAYNELNEYVGCDSCVGIGCKTSITGFEVTSESEPQVFPNPFHCIATVAIRQPVAANRPVCLELYNAQGVQVQQYSQLNNPHFVITREGLSNGLYFYRILAGSKLLGTGKIAVD